MELWVSKYMAIGGILHMKTGEKVHQEPKTGEIVHENRRKSTSKAENRRDST